MILAGGPCWFEGGITDSFGPLQVLDDGLGFLPGGFCPHFDTQPVRQSLFRDAVASGALPPGYAVDDFAALHFRGMALVEAVSSRASSVARHVWPHSQSVVEEPLTLLVLQAQRS